MKLPIVCTSMLLLVLSVCSSNATATARGPTETVLLISQSIPKPELLLSAIEQHLNTARPGSRVHVVHGGRTVASFWVPNGTGKTRFRSRHVQPAWAKIVRLLSRSTEGSNQIDLPGLATAIKGRHDTRLPLRVAIYGSPLYLDPQKQAYSHQGKFVTADGAIDVEPSPFRTDQKLPAGTRVTWITPDALFGYDSVHRDAVIRFNTLFIQELGGELIRTSDKLELLFNHFSPQPTGRIVRRTDDGNTRVQRSEDSRVENADPTAPATLDQKVMNIASRESADSSDAREAMVAKAMASSNRIAIIITWESEDPNCDLDMWLTSNGLEGEVYHANPQLPWAELTRDVQQTRHAAGEPNVEKHEGVLVKHGRLEDLTLWINVFRTRSPATVKITRIWNRERKSRTVQIKTASGDGGQYYNWRSGSAAWKRVNLLRFSAADDPGSL